MPTKNNTHKYEIVYSLYTDSIKKQLKKNYLLFDKEEVKLIQGLSYSIMNLKFHEIISEGVAEKAHAKLHEKLVEHLDKCNFIKPE